MSCDDNFGSWNWWLPSWYLYWYGLPTINTSFQCDIVIIAAGDAVPEKRSWCLCSALVCNNTAHYVYWYTANMKFTIMGTQSCPALIQCQHYTLKHQRLPTHSAWGVGMYVHMYVCTYVRMYVVCTVCNAHAWVIEAENSVTLTIQTSFIVLRWYLRTYKRLWFCLWVYLPGPWIHNQDYEYLYIQVSCSRLNTRLHSVALSTFVIKLFRQC